MTLSGKISPSALVVLVFLGICGIYLAIKYNSLVNQNHKIVKAWSNVSLLYQKRAQLTNNLVKTIESTTNIESTFIADVNDAQAKCSVIQWPIDLTDDQNGLISLQQSEAALDIAVSKLVANLRAKHIANMESLIVQVNSANANITSAKEEYNILAFKYNKAITVFPDNALAFVFGYHPKAYFKSDDVINRLPISGINF